MLIVTKNDSTLKENMNGKKRVLSVRLHQLAVVFRVLLGALLLYAGMSKALDPESLAVTVANYKIPPFNEQPWDMWLGYFLPIFEVVIGFFLLINVFSRGAAILSGLMSLSFLGAVVSVWSRGLDIHCGCFGDNEVFQGYFVHVLLLIAMILVSAFLWAAAWKTSR